MPTLIDDLTTDGSKSRLFPAIEAAISESFKDGGTRTRHEIRRRFDICYDLAKQLRYDLGWGLSRIMDHLPTYLRYELDGVTWEPDKRACWVPADGAL